MSIPYNNGRIVPQISAREGRRQVLLKNNMVKFLPWIAAESRVMQRVESIIIRQHNISIVVQQQRQHVIPLFTDGIMKRCIAFRVLNQKKNHRFPITSSI